LNKLSDILATLVTMAMTGRAAQYEISHRVQAWLLIARHFLVQRMLDIQTGVGAAEPNTSHRGWPLGNRVPSSAIQRSKSSHPTGAIVSRYRYAALGQFRLVRAIRDPGMGRTVRMLEAVNLMVEIGHLPSWPRIEILKP
jgi:hypothetical protein